MHVDSGRRDRLPAFSTGACQTRYFMSSPHQEPPNALESWQARTPPVTRYTLYAIVSMYIISFFATNAVYAFANIPLFVLRGEVWRLLFSTLFSNSIFSVLFMGLTLSQQGSMLERATGSLAYAHLIVSTAWLTNLCFFFWSLLLAYNPVFPAREAMVGSSIGFWPVIMALIVVECSLWPTPTRQLLFIPVQIQTKMYPLCLMCVFFLFTFSWDLPIGLALGYARIGGWMRKLSPSQQSLLATERSANSIFDFLVNSPGYIGVEQAMGAQIFTNDGAAVQEHGGDSQSSSANGWGFGSTNRSTDEEAQFPGLGQALAASMSSGDDEQSRLLHSPSQRNGAPLYADRASRAAAAERAALARAQRFDQGGKGSFQFESELARMESMGYTASAAKDALIQANGSIEHAVLTLSGENDTEGLYE